MYARESKRINVHNFLIRISEKSLMMSWVKKSDDVGQKGLEGRHIQKISGVAGNRRSKLVF